ncbi:MAG TPA: PEP/pyruvate-binding domain-containing protein, partial [Kofleriaceae bacterium]
MNTFIVDLDAAGAHPDVSVLGGKGARLAEMMNAGLAVPPGFCITVHALREHLRDSGVTGGDDFAVVRAQLAATTLPAELARDIVSAYERIGRPRVAVRSSSIAEDS